MPAMEAMMCGTALVTTDTGGSRDYALNEETALVSPIKNPEGLAKNLIRVLTNESLRLQLAEKGYQKIQQFSVLLRGKKHQRDGRFLMSGLTASAICFAMMG